MSVLLPSGYTQIEYIQSSGTQYIDTNIPAIQYYKVNIDFQWLSSGDQTIIGGNGGKTSVIYLGCNSSSNTSYYFNWSNSWIDIPNMVDNNRHQVEISLESGNITINRDNTNIYSSSDTLDGATTSSETLKIFCRTNLNNKWTGRIYDLKFYDLLNNSILINHFIPCIQDSDDAIGLYDIVNNQFYGNSGTGTFVAGPEIDWKDYYQEVQYIQSSGTQYIDTGIIPTVSPTNLKYIVKCNSESGYSSDNCILGARLAGGYAGSGYKLNLYDTVTEYQDIVTPSGSNVWSPALRDQEVVYEVQVKSGDTYYKENGVTKASHSTTGTTDTHNQSLYLMAMNQSGAQWFYHGKIYYLKIWDQDVFVQDLVPCYRKSDDKPGMYDIIAGQFLTNAGTGDFTVGPDVLPPKMYFGGTEVNDIYYNGNIVNDVYFNGVLVKEGSYVPPLIIFNDDFESYTVGAFPSSVYSIVYNGTGDANQKVISTTQRDGTTGNVLQLQGANNWAAQIRHTQTFDTNYRYIVFEIDVKFVNTGAFALGSSQASGQWSKNVCGVAYNASTGNLWATYNDTGTNLGVAYTSNVWVHFKIVLDRDNSKQYIYQDNVLLNPNGDTASSVIPEWVTLEAGNNGTNTGYYDNLNVYETNNINL